MNEPTGFFVGSPTELPMCEIVRWLFNQQYGKINGCARSKRLWRFFVHYSAISPPNCTPVYNRKEENNGIRKM